MKRCSRMRGELGLLTFDNDEHALQFLADHTGCHVRVGQETTGDDLKTIKQYLVDAVKLIKPVPARTANALGVMQRSPRLLTLDVQDRLRRAEEAAVQAYEELRSCLTIVENELEASSVRS